MKNLIFLIIVIFILSACSHNIPIANIEFTKIEKENKPGKYYNLYFSSDIELINNLQDGYAYTRVDCLFDNKNLEDIDFINYNGYVLTSVGNLKLVTKNSKYTYKVSVFFETNNNNPNTEEKTKVMLEIKKLLNEKPDCLSCAISAVAFMNVKERYTSKIMCLPKTEIIKVMKQ